MLNISKLHFSASALPRLPSHTLHYGRTSTPLARVVPDSRWPNMWRIVWPDGRTSDVVNLARARDAAQATAERGPPARDRKLFHWKTSNSPSQAPPVAPIASTRPEAPPAEIGAARETEP